MRLSPLLVSAGIVTLAGVVSILLWQALRFKKYNACDVSGYDLVTYEPILTDAKAIEACKATRGCNTVFQWKTRQPKQLTILKGVPSGKKCNKAGHADYTLSTSFLDGSYFTNQS